MSNAITTIKGTGIPVRGNDIDTDRIIPARFMKCVTFEGLGQYAFYDQRFDEGGAPKEHPFNDDAYAGGSILIANKNFGCGSSREHAPQALQKFGVQAVVAESFAEIFAGNCTVMGIPVVTASASDIESLMCTVEARPETSLTVDLENLTVSTGTDPVSIAMQASQRHALIAGTWDSTALLLANRVAIDVTAGRIPYLNGFAVAGR